MSLTTTGNFRKAALSSSNQANPFHTFSPFRIAEAPLTSQLNNTCEMGTSFISDDASVGLLEKPLPILDET